MSDIKTKPIFIPGLVESPTGLKDNTIKFTVRCNELPPEKIGQIFSLNNKFVYLGIKEESFLNEEMELLESLESDELIGKTPSQRLKNVLFVNWKNNTENFQSFEQYYKFKMEKLIDFYKSKLPQQ